MHNDNVYYIKVNPYIHNLHFDTMIMRFLKSNIIDKNGTIFSEFIKNEMNKYHFTYVEKNEKEYELDKIVTKKIMMHIQDFFKKKYFVSTPTREDNQQNTINTIKTKKNMNKLRSKHKTKKSRKY